MNKKNILAGTIILTSANLITRLMGFFYRIYMSNTIGAEGMGLYQLIMPIYMLAWSITSSGFTTTISKLTAQENAKGQYGNMGQILKIAVFMCFSISIVVMAVMFIGAGSISVNILHDKRTYISLRILALAVPFMSAGSCIRGYFFGLQNSVVPAVSQVLEQFIRIAVIFVLSPLFIPMGLEYACGAAVIGVFLGEAISFVFVFLSYIGFKKKNSLNRKPSMSIPSGVLVISSMALPLTASRVMASLLSTAENILIPQCLQLYSHGGESAMSIYGKLTGMAIPLIQMPSALLMAVSITLVPAISEAQTVRNKKRITNTVSMTILLTSIIGIGAACLFAVFPKEISIAVYNQIGLADTLCKLALVCPLMYLQITLSGILNGLGKHTFIFINNILSSIISISFIYFFMPSYGTDAFIIGWILSLALTVSLSIYKVLHETKTKADPINWFLKPLMSALAGGLTVRYILMRLKPTRIVYILGSVLMLLMYMVFLISLGCIKKKDLKAFTKH